MRGLPGWLSLGYITVQLWMLLDTALRIRPASVIDAVLAIAPVITGIVCGVLWMVGHLHLSLFQLNALAMLIATGMVEFVSTLWVRNVRPAARDVRGADPDASLTRSAYDASAGARVSAGSVAISRICVTRLRKSYPGTSRSRRRAECRGPRTSRPRCG